MAYRHALRVRYGECDMQQVVFNANYLAYIDDAIDTWMRHGPRARSRSSASTSW